MFKRREHKETETSQKFWAANVNGVSDIARSLRETAKFQVRGKPWRNMHFFLIAAAVILFTLLYAYYGEKN